MAKKSDPVARVETLFLALRDDPESAKVVARAKLRLLLDLSDPKGAIAVDGRTQPFGVLRDPPSFAPDLTLAMSCATADRFFLGTLDLAKAIASKEILSRGSLLRMLELRSLLTRAREFYRQVK